MRATAILLTGAPGSGKSTLGRELTKELRIPFIARDDIRGGLAFTGGAWSDQMNQIPAGSDAVSLFLQTVELLLSADVSCAVEYVWRSDRPGDLDRILAAGHCVVIKVICANPMQRVIDRNESDRLISNPAVLAAAGAGSVATHTAAVVQRMERVEREMLTEFDLPTLVVNTTNGYKPDLDAIIDFVTARD